MHQVHYFNLPNSLILNQNLIGSDFAVAAYLYSLYSTYGHDTLLGATVKVKQATIADYCQLSTDTVLKATKRLIQHGIILDKKRTVKSNGHLGTYTYTLQNFNKSEHKYTRISKKAATILQPNDFKLYALFCLCKENNKNSFFHSYNDLIALTKKKKSQIIEIINKLISIGVIRKQKRKTKCGDYTENKYFIIIQIRGTIKTQKKIATYVESGHYSKHFFVNIQKNITYTNHNIIQYYICQVFFKYLVVPKIRYHSYNPLIYYPSDK